MPKDIALFDHNEKAYEALVSSLENDPLAFIEHATGTGKSFILLKYLYTKMRNKRILFITRHHEMLGQLFDEQMPSLGISKDDFYKFDAIIYPNILDLDMEEVINNYDCIVWDEAHHCGAPKWSIKVNEAKELVKKTPGKVMIGATATRIRYLDDYMDVAETFFDGNVVSVLPVTRSILKNLLPAPLIIMTAQSCLENIERIQKKLGRIPQVPAVKEYKKVVEYLKNKLIDEFYVGNVLKQYGVKPGEKYIVFCRDINDVKRKMMDAEEWFKNIGPVKMYSAHSEQKRSTNIKQIAEFSNKRDEISLMFAVDIFNEGFHIDGVDGILIFRKTQSPIIYWQQLGRALSFSARKKQIKIFDFVNNTSENKVVYELYKEMLDEARKLIIEDPENKPLYEEILSRFKIVDQTASILDQLHAIENKIDQEFIIRSRVDLAIYKLEEYRSFYPNTNFNEELLGKRLGQEYVRAYEYICSMEDYLTLDEVNRLQQLNITFTAKIDLKEDKRRKILGDSKTFKELEEQTLETFIQSYVSFCNNNNRRPTIDDDKNLYLSYREYLYSLSRSKLNKFLAQVPFRLSLEETILLGNYPSRDDINNYLDEINLKIRSSIPLDVVEIKVLKKISHAIPSKDVDLLNYITKFTDINYQIDEAIAIIQSYNQRDSVLDSKKYKKALSTIERLALRINNRQFELLLELGIKLPNKINMTMEERLKELDGYDSFYDKKQVESLGAINAYIVFIQRNKRRPNMSIENEARIQIDYKKQLFKTTKRKIHEVVTALEVLNIPLSLEESVLTKSAVDISELENYVLSIREKLRNDQKVSKEDLRMLRAIERGEYRLNINVSNLVKMVVNINAIDEMLSNYESNKFNDFQKRNVMRNIFQRSRFFTRKHLKRLSDLHITVPNEIIDNLEKSPDFINLFEQETKAQEEFWNEFIKYLEVHKQYPEDDSLLMQKYHYYLSYASNETMQKMLLQIKNMGITLNIEDRILLQDFTRDEGIAYLESIKNKVKNEKELDPFESRVCRVLDKIIPTEYYGTKIKPLTVDIGQDLENRIVRNLESCIRLNPFEPLDLENNYSLSRQNRRKLEVYRINTLGKKVFHNILRQMKSAKKPLSEAMDENLIQPFNELSHSKDLNVDNEYLLNQIKALDREYILKQRGYQLAEFISKYIDFVKNSNGTKPNITSLDEDERNLAITYEEVHDLLDMRDIQRIEKSLKSSFEEDDIMTFYPRLIAFINEFGRFPCGNSDNPYEVHLNTLFQNIGANLTKDQNNEIKKLRRTYGRATILANIEFSKKLGHKK